MRPLSGTMPLHLPLRRAREQVIEQFERQAYLVAKLKEHGGNVTRAAEAMEVSRQFLHRLLDRYGIRSGSCDDPEAVNPGWLSRRALAFCKRQRALPVKCLRTLRAPRSLGRESREGVSPATLSR